MNAKRINIEGVILLIFIFSFLYLGLANVWDKNLNHNQPYAYLASDSFLHNSIAEYSKAEGRFKYSPPYDVGRNEGVLEAHPAYLPAMTIMISQLSGLDTHDAIYMTVLVITLAGILVLYTLNRNYNKNIALLSLPVALLMLSRLFNMMLFWGIWYFATGVALMLGAAYFIPKIAEKKTFILFGVLYGALMIAHIPEAIFLIGFIALYMVIKMLKSKKFLLGEIKCLSYGGVLGAVLAIFYINVFRSSFLITEGFRGTPSGGYFGFPNIFITHLGIIGIIFLIGFGLNLLTKKRFSYPILLGSFFFGVSYLTYFGFGKRAFTHRFFWHVYLGIFFGIIVFYLAKIVIKKWNILYTSILFLVILVIIAKPLNGITNVGQGIMDPYNWKGLMWLRENVDKDTPVFYFYTDTLSQAATLYSSHHASFKIGNKNLTKSIESGKLQDTYRFGLADAQPVLICELGFLKIGYYRNTYRPDNLEYKCEPGYKGQIAAQGNWWLCDLEYIYFNKFSRNQVLADYSIGVAKLLLRVPWIKQAYENELVLILHNEKPGDECIGIDTES